MKWTLFQQYDSLSKAQLRSGLKWLYTEGIASMGMGSILGGGFLTAYTLLLGANVFQVGFVGAAPFIFQPLQLAYVPVTDYLRRRKLLTLLPWILVTLLWIPAALLPFSGLTASRQVSVLMVIVSVQGVLRPLIAVNWQSWLRDLIPGRLMGAVFSRRLAYGTIAAIGLGLSASLFVDYWRTTRDVDAQIQGYTLVFLSCVAVLGFLSPWCMARIPERRSQPGVLSGRSRWTGLGTPVQDREYRPILWFLFMRNFYTALAAPFFVVYMLEKLAFPLSLVIGFGTLSQAANVSILSVWGKYADRFGAKVVMMASGSLMLLLLPLWSLVSSVNQGGVGAGLPVYLLIGFCMVLQGLATAGTNVASGIMTMKRAGHQRTSAYLSLASMAGNLGAGLGPLVGGRLIDVLLQRQLTIHVDWIGPSASVEFAGLSLGGYEFLFLLAFLLGLVTSSLLARIHELQDHSRSVVLDELYKDSAATVRALNSIPGARFLQVPVSVVRSVPGIDTVLGLTLYQFSSTMRLAVATSQVGSRSVRNLSSSVRGSLAQMLQGRRNLGTHAEEIAYHAARAATQAMEDTDLDPRLVVQDSLKGIVQEMDHRLEGQRSRRILRGTVRGAVRGTYETRQDLEALIPTIYQAGMTAAAELGIQPEKGDALVRGAIQYTASYIRPRLSRNVRAQLETLKYRPSHGRSKARA
ncbi:MAG: MFS transporter [Caldilineaceae bacterium]|nr:MFS transporter [Caldilineaceae bacterium]